MKSNRVLDGPTNCSRYDTHNLLSVKHGIAYIRVCTVCLIRLDETVSGPFLGLFSQSALRDNRSSSAVKALIIVISLQCIPCGYSLEGHSWAPHGHLCEALSKCTTAYYYVKEWERYQYFHYKNTPIQIYWIFTTKKGKFSDEKFWFFFVFLFKR